MNRMKIIKCFGLSILCYQLVFSATVFSQAHETKLPSAFFQNTKSGFLSIKHHELKSLLLSDKSSVVIAIPLPNGTLVNFKLTPDDVMADGLAKKYPNIRTFSGESLDDPSQTGRFDITPNGFHGMFYYQNERVFIEPENVYVQDELTLRSSKPKRVFEEVNNVYKSYFAKDEHIQSNQPHNFQQPKRIAQQLNTLADSLVYISKKPARTGKVESVMTTYRIAISAAAEYTQFNGGTVDSAMAEIITLVNRLNQVYQHDLAVKLELVENNDLLVFTDANSDPFANNSDDGELNTAVIDGIIGSENYDIGHIVNTEGGGLAILGGVCNQYYKGDGVTGSSRPINDSFYIDYVAHEVGHQFGADHTFNGTAGACDGNRVSYTAYEVGSGSTIMSYAGICGNEDLQNHSDPFFHSISIDQINTYLEDGEGSNCGIVSGVANKTPVVNAGPDHTIPARTPFTLLGSAQDEDSSNLTFSWQQFDLGASSSSRAEQVDDGTRPIFRAFKPSNDPSRSFPKLSDVLNDTSTIGESLPTTNRELNFRLMAFDDEGGVSFDEAKLTVIDTGEAFSLNSPSTGDEWTGNSNISWQVAETNTAPISCSAVDILLSKDGGNSFDTTLRSNVPNDGNADISLDNFCAEKVNTSQARIKLVCSNNVFYAVNKGVFSINKALNASDIDITNQQAISLVQGVSVTLSTSQFTYACEEASSITIQNGENYTFVGETITPNSNFSGELTVSLVANKGGITSDVYEAKITVQAKVEPEPTQPTSKSSGSMFWLLLFVTVLPWRIRRFIK